MRRDVSRCNAESAQNQPVRIMRYAALEEKTRNGIFAAVPFLLKSIRILRNEYLFRTRKPN